MKNAPPRQRVYNMEPSIERFKVCIGTVALVPDRYWIMQNVARKRKESTMSTLMRGDDQENRKPPH